MQVIPDPNDVTTLVVATDWDIQHRADYEEERGPRPLVHSSRTTNRRPVDESENHHE